MATTDKNNNTNKANKTDKTDKTSPNPLPADQLKPIDRGFSGKLFYKIGMFLTRLGVDIETRGTENIPQNAPYMLAANHETYVDGMWILSALPEQQFDQFCCIGAQDLLTKYGIFGRIIMKVGRGIPINRFGNPIRALIVAKEALEEKNVLLIHPEGTRSTDGRLGIIHEGACFISKKSKSKIIPVFLDGGYEIFGRHMKLPRFTDAQTKKKNRLIITFGQAIDPDDYKNVKSMNLVLTQWFEEHFQKKEIPRFFST